MSFPTWKTNTGNSFIFPNSILDGQVDVSGTFYNRTGNVIIGDSANPDFDPSSNGITLNTTRICLGKDSSVTGDNGVAIGNSATTGLQENSISIGYNSIVDASNSVAIGPNASANGLNSIALGYNSGTGSYTNSVALGANSTVGANNVISLGDGTQKVGIGVTTPTRELDVDGSVKITNWFRVSGTGGIHWEDYSGGWYMNDTTWLQTWNNSSIWAGTGTIATNGSVGIGIGTSAPTYPLHVVGKAYFNDGIYVDGHWDYIDYTNAQGDYLTNGGGVQGDPPAWHFSAHFDNAIEAYGIVVTSDERIKDNINNINDDIALQQLRLLSPKTYTYKDTIKRGSQEVIGFIAQEVREVLPRSVALGTNYIPSIMKLATAFNKEGNTIEIRLDTSLDDITTLTTGTKIKIIIKSKGIETSILSFSNDVFEISKTEEFTVTDGENVFVYGEIVEDFHFLDKNAIFTVATAALQEVDRQLQAEKVKTATLETQITDLLARVTALENP